MNQYPRPVHAAADSVPNKDMSSTAWSDVSEMDGGRVFRSEAGAEVQGVHTESAETEN